MDREVEESGRQVLLPRWLPTLTLLMIHTDELGTKTRKKSGSEGRPFRRREEEVVIHVSPSWTGTHPSMGMVPFILSDTNGVYVWFKRLCLNDRHSDYKTKKRLKTQNSESNGELFRVIFPSTCRSISFRYLSLICTSLFIFPRPITIYFPTSVEVNKVCHPCEYLNVTTTDYFLSKLSSSMTLSLSILFPGVQD